MTDKFIKERYQVITCLKKKQFKTIYLAKDIQLREKPLRIVKKFKPKSNENFVMETIRRLFCSGSLLPIYKFSSHSQIPIFIDHFEIDNYFYCVEEYIEGENLSQEIISDNCWQENEAQKLLEEVLEIIAFIQQYDVVHRDINPSNLIRRNSDGKIILIDFGWEKNVFNMISSEEDKIGLTVPDLGTFGYIPREQLRGKYRYSSDLYALGMIVIQAITGLHPTQLPMDKETGEIMWKEKTANLNPKFANILDKMTRQNFRERYQNAEEVIYDLRRYSSSLPLTSPMTSSNNPWLFLSSILFSLLLGLGICLIIDIDNTLYFFKNFDKYDNNSTSSKVINTAKKISNLV